MKIPKRKLSAILLGGTISIFILATLWLLFISPQLELRAAELPDSPESYADFVDKTPYSTLGFQYSEDDEIPVCFLLDVYDYLHEQHGDRILSWRIVYDERVDYVFAFPSGWLGHYSPKDRRLMKFVTDYESPKACDKAIEELNYLFPAVPAAQ